MGSSTEIDSLRDAAELAEKLAEAYEADLEGVRQERAALDAREGRLERLVADLRGEVEAKRGRLFDAPPTPIRLDLAKAPNGTSRRLSTGPAIVTILEAEGRPMTATEVYRELEQRGWLPEAEHPRNAVGTALWNLATRQRIDKLGSGPASRRWAAKTSPVEPTNAPPGREDVD